MFPLIQASCSDPVLLHQIQRLEDLLQQLHDQQLASSENETDGSDDYPDSDSELGERYFDPESVAAMIRSTVDCLMQLLPSMERTLEVANNKIRLKVT
jgi:hypothetical protein